jgi:pilus assembly protein CpaE
MLAGARDFLTKPPMIDDLIQAVEGAAAIARTEKSKTIQASRIARTAAHPVARSGHIITVYGPKGGVGCTTIASNLAVALADNETSVVLVDADLLYGDVAVYFNEHSVNTLADLTPRAQDLDPEVIEDVLITHSSGVKLLSAPRPADAEEINPGQFSDLIKYLRSMFMYVIIDTSTKLSDITIAALDASDLLILITGHGIPDISRTQKSLELLPLLKFDPENTVVVMNQYDKRINISPEKVAKSFNKEISVVFPKDDRIVIPSVNRGEPFMLRSGIMSRPIGQAMRSLAALIRKRIKAQIEKPEPVGY